MEDVPAHNGTQTDFQHPAWTTMKPPAGLEFEYRNWRNPGSHWALAAVGAWSIFCLWQIFGFLKNWIIDRAEVLPAGVVLFFLLLGGCWAGVVLTGNLFERCIYILGDSTFRFRKYRIDRAMQETVIEKSRISKVYRLYTAPKHAKSDGVWRTVIGYADSSGKERELALDGHSEEEADFLGGSFASWTGLKITKENTGQ